MKTLRNLAVIALLAFGASFADATTFWSNGVLYGNVCRNGAYYTVYPLANAQPVGTVCPVRDNYGNFLMQGVVSNE